MTERLRWGILATGGIARLMTSDLVANGFDVTAVASRRLDSAEAFAAEFGIPTAHVGYEALASDPDVDIVYVATPHPVHVENALLMLESGKHVIVEKPFALNAREATAIASLAKARGLLAMEAMWTRYLPHMVRIRELIAQGALGEVRTLMADHMQRLPDDPSHRLNSLELGGGALLDLGVYPVSFAWELFGEPETIQATATFKPTGADAQVATVFGYPGGRIATSVSASDTAGPNTAVVVGTEARIEIDGVWFANTSFRLIDSAGTVLEEFSQELNGRGMHFQAEAAERLVASGELGGDVLPIDETVAIMGTLDRVRELIGLRYPGE
ncbi:oxidoreductase [Agromyces rhizosphaerae]|uniref:Oxidoreductase n=1 Tax=Agromyces rhizosphaerae TaxID=88374 RepID=A0A9W6CVN2_9MICO|nr:Gfo/Idh/MocA family oxidoreductase [Agromyces rhizosphaerae]GLI26169.1 oxidoreductase [Agromyces rhizosphaerae]